MASRISPRHVELREGFADGERAQVATMYWSAFGEKLGAVLRPTEKALALLAHCLDPARAIAARSADGHLLGIAGYETERGSFTSIDLRALTRVYGPVGGTWRGLLLSVLERPPEPGTLLMDGIVVTRGARGGGVGTLLLGAIKAKARSLGFRRVRLDVVDTNLRARALYEREGFVATRTARLGPLRHVFRFSEATTMTADIG